MSATGETNLRPLGIGEILDAAIRVYRNNFKTLTTAVLVIVLPLTIINTFITASTSENAFDYDDTATIDDEGSFIAGQLVTVVISILMYSLATAACFHAVMRGYMGESATWRESLAFGLKRMWPIIALGILAFLGLIPMFLLLIIPGIWLAVRWSVAAPALLAEDLGPAAALGRSFKLVAGRWWATFGALVAMTILISILQFLVGLLMGLIFAGDPSEVIVATVFTIVTALAYAVTLPIQAAVFTILYYDLRVRKEGYDLQLAAGGMGGAPPAMPSADPAGGGFSAPSEGGFSPPSPGGGFAPPQQPAPDTSTSVPPPAPGSGAIPTPIPAPPPAPATRAPEPPAPEPSSWTSTPAPEPATPAPETTPEPPAPEQKEPDSGGFSWNPTPDADDTPPAPPGEETPPASR